MLEMVRLKPLAGGDTEISNMKNDEKLNFKVKKKVSNICNVENRAIGFWEAQKIGSTKFSFP